MITWKADRRRWRIRRQSTWSGHEWQIDLGRRRFVFGRPPDPPPDGSEDEVVQPLWRTKESPRRSRS